MEPLEHVNNQELLSHLAGPTVAEALMKQYGWLTGLAKASFNGLQTVKGIGESKAAATRSVFLLPHRLTKEAYPEAPMMDTPERVADYLREQNRPCGVRNFPVMFLNARRRLVALENISQATLGRCKR